MTATDNTSTDFGANAWLVDEMYERYHSDPTSVSETWQEFFEDYKPSHIITAAVPATAPGAAPTPAPVAAPAAAAPVAQAAPATQPAPATPAPPAAVAAPAEEPGKLILGAG